QLFIHLAAANHDPAKFENPHELDIERSPNPHLGFGAGAHHCLGAPFARQNLRIGLGEILDRMEDIGLCEDDPPRRTAGIGWMMERLPISFTPGVKRAAWAVRSGGPPPARLAP